MTAFSQAQQTKQSQTLNLTGTCKITQAGSCSMTTAPFNVKLELTIDATTGEIKGREFRLNSKNEYEPDETVTWTGEVLNSMALRLKQTMEIICGDDKRTEILHFIGVFTCTEDMKCSMKIDDTYAMCPAANCIFDIEYDLKLVN